MTYETRNWGKPQSEKITCGAYHRSGHDSVPSEVVSADVAMDGHLHVRVDTGGKTPGAKGHDVRISIPIHVMLHYLPEMIKMREAFELSENTRKLAAASGRETRLNSENRHLRQQLAIAEQKRKDAEAALAKATSS